MTKHTKLFLCVLLSIVTAVCILAACNVDDDPVDVTKYNIVNGDFEKGDLSGWEVISGTAFSSVGVTDAYFDVVFNGTVPYNKDGEYLFGRYNEAGVGKMLSSAFEIGGSGYITFKMGGAQNPALTYLSVVDAATNEELYRFGNSAFNTTDYETDPDNYFEANLVAYYADLSRHLGKTVRIAAVDDSTANWGFMTLDSFVTYYETAPDLDGFIQARDIKPVFTDKTGTPNELYNGDFSDGLNGWTVVGDKDSFKEEHINDNNRLSNRPDESSVGVLRSSAFKVGGKNLISFRLGCTKNSDLTYLSIKKVGTNEEIFRTYSNRWQPAHEEATHLYYVDLSEFKGECLYLEAVDNSRGDWGCISLEDVVTLYTDLPNVTDEIAVNINERSDFKASYTVMRNYMNGVISAVNDVELRKTLQKTFYATLDGISAAEPGVLHYNADGTTFCYTGDIHAMWLRDSSAQVLQYLQFLNMDYDVRFMVKGLLRKQFEQIRRDPYANAFNPDGSVFERKFEIDSLCYPIWLAYEYYEITGDDSIFDVFFQITAQTIIKTFKAEQNHSDDNYRIEHHNDLNSGVNEFNPNCGLIWSGYRPSDDVCYYKYFIPGNMFAVATLEKLNYICVKAGLDSRLAETAKTMAEEIRGAIETYGVYNHPKYGRIYAFEVTGFTSDVNSSDGKLLIDAANIPSLISAPWLGYCGNEDETYVKTRRFVLSGDNPYYYEGKYACGIGDPHELLGSNNDNNKQVPWHMSIAMQALTSNDIDEINRCVKYMTDSTGGTYAMHEAFNADDPTEYSRNYFTWPCSLYAHTVVTKVLGVDVLKENTK